MGKIEKVYLLGTHKDIFRTGEPAEIISIKMVTPMHLEKRLCYEIEYSDGIKDFQPISDKGYSYEIFTLKELVNNGRTKE